MRIRTGYSFRSAVGHLEEVADRLEECGYECLPMTDTSGFGWVRWEKIAKKRNLKPIYGIEIGVSEQIQAKKPTIDRWTFIAKGDLKPLNELLKIATEQFRYEPLLTYEQAMEVDAFKIAGSKSRLELMVPETTDLFIGLSPSVSTGFFKQASKKGFKWIECSDNSYTNKNDEELYQIICGRGANTQSYDQHILTRSEWYKWAVEKFGEPVAFGAVNRFKDVMEGSTAKLKKADLFVPEKPKTLEQMCREGADDLDINLDDPVYAARLKTELDLIDDKKFEDYFYIIADICQWARKRMVVGPARGSSCGSLVCYLLKITTVDPIPYGLIFERFIDVNRDDLPDIDIDFSDEKRNLVFDYMNEKYGADHVARLGTVALYKPKSCLNEAAAALDIPPWEVDKVTDSIIERSGGDSRALQALEDTLSDTNAGKELIEKFPEIKISSRMEGHPRHYSQHAAGIVLTDKPIIEFVPIDARTGATQCDKKDAEDLNLLKIDALGLTQLSIFEDTLRRLNLPIDFLDTIPLDDKKAFDQLNDGKYSGIFQFNGAALQSVTNQIHVDDLEDIVSITALARPGPLNTGGTNHWIKVKTGKESLVYPHEIFKPYLEQTLGVVTFQEQVMNIGREIGDLSWGDVTALRKAMSKSLGKEYFDQFGDKWKAAAIKKGVPEDIAAKVWDDLCAYGSWAFNRSHAVAYGLVSYYCCWLKAHYPLEFAASALTHAKTPETQIAMLRELAAEGFDYVPVDVETSTDRWEIKGKTLVGPVTNVKGIGPKRTEQIVTARRTGEKLPPSVVKTLSDAKTQIDSLYPITDRFIEVMPDPAERNIHTPPTAIGTIDTNGSWQNVLVFCTPSQIKPLSENEEARVQKRGHKLTGPTQALNLRLTDDTGTIFAKVDRFNYEKLGKPIIERGRPGKSLYAIKGSVPKDFLMIKVEMIRYIGDLDNDTHLEIGNDDK